MLTANKRLSKLSYTRKILMKKANVEIKNRSRLFETIRSLAIVALVAMIGLTMTVCDTGGKTDPKCTCIEKVHPYGEPCDCPAEGTAACTCTEAQPLVGDPECDCVEKVHPYGEPCDCEAEGTAACTCTEEPPECTCTVKVHPLGEPCDCPLAGTESCDCTEEGEPLKFTVIFDPNDGVTQHTTHLVTEGGTATKPADPTRENYTFVYWYDSETDLEWDFETVVTAEITLKAKWAYQSFMDMVPVGSGSFEMGYGATDVTPVHTVTLSSFSISRYEVTQKEYETVTGYLPSGIAATAKGDKFPVYLISWYDAVEFCNKLSDLEGLTPVYTITDRTPVTGYPITSATVTANWSNNGYRLPTEAEWEYAAKGGPLADIDPDPDDVEYYTYAGGNNAALVARTGNNNTVPLAVGSFTNGANQLGLYDMSGNAYEWCWDWFAAYQSGPQNNPTGPSTGTQRVMRGGSFRNTIAYATVVYRMQNDPDTTQALGIRLVRNAE